MIEARNLTKRYGGRTVVDDVSFDARPGAVTGLLGPTGAGKSTTIRLLLSLARGGGHTRFDGVRYPQLRDPMRHVGAMLDAPAFHPSRTARTHLRMVAAANGIGRTRVDEVLDWVGLTAVADRRAKEYSLGMAQRLGLAVALLGDPPNLILDEPANGLDPAGIGWLRGFLRALAAEGRTVLVAGHLLAEMAQTADRLVVLGAGRLVADEPAASFTARSSKAGVVVVRTPHMERLGRILAQAGASVARDDLGLLTVSGLTPAQIGEFAFRHEIVLHELGVRQAALEDAFLELTEAGDERAALSRIPAQGGAKENVR
jgi:ABC-2 type transport system ATP-binding protein